MNEIAKREDFTRKRVNQIRGKLNEAKHLWDGNACIYATGSYGRCEASEHSDPDIFIVGKTALDKDEKGGTIEKRSLTRLNEIRIKADLINLTQDLGLPEFSRDGAYLQYLSL